MDSWLFSLRAPVGPFRPLRRVLAAAFTGWLVLPSSAHAISTTDKPSSWLDGRFYMTSPARDSMPKAEIGANFRAVLPWGSKVELHYGFGIADAADRQIAIWRHHSSQEALAMGPYTWAAWVEQPLDEPNRRYVTSFQFVWKIIRPDGSHFFIRGGSSRNGFYEARMPNPRQIEHVGRDDAAVQRLDIFSVQAD